MGYSEYKRKRKKHGGSTFFGFIHPGTLRKHETSRCVLLSRLVPHIPLGKITFLLTGRTWLVLGPQLGIQFNWCVGFQRLMLELCLEHETSSIGN